MRIDCILKIVTEYANGSKWVMRKKEGSEIFGPNRIELPFAYVGKAVG